MFPSGWSRLVDRRGVLATLSAVILGAATASASTIVPVSYTDPTTSSAQNTRLGDTTPTPTLLTNGVLPAILAGVDAGSGWVGWDRANAILTFDFGAGSAPAFGTVEVWMEKDTGVAIYLPTQIAVSFSPDGTTFSNTQTLALTGNELANSSAGWLTVGLSGAAEQRSGRFVRIVETTPIAGAGLAALGHVLRRGRRRG